MARSGHGHTSAEAIDSKDPEKFGKLMMRLSLHSLEKAIQQTDQDREWKPYTIISHTQTSTILGNWLFVSTSIIVEY